MSDLMLFHIATLMSVCPLLTYDAFFITYKVPDVLVTFPKFLDFFYNLSSLYPPEAVSNTSAS